MNWMQEDVLQVCAIYSSRSEVSSQRKYGRKEQVLDKYEVQSKRKPYRSGR